MEHRLKTWPEYFNAVKSGAKPFEVRYADRNFSVGDTLVLEEYDPKTNEYTGDAIVRQVTYILDMAYLPGQRHDWHGYVAMGIAPPVEASRLDEIANLRAELEQYRAENAKLTDEVEQLGKYLNVGTVNFIHESNNEIKQLQAELYQTQYNLIAVMQSVDKWLSGDELKQNESTRATTMREKTLREVERLQAELVKEREKAESEINSMAQSMAWPDLCAYCKEYVGEDFIRCKDNCFFKWRGMEDNNANG